MKKATKGALAVAAAGTMMLGGAGSLAYWTGTSNVTGTAINSGTLTLGTEDCTVAAGTHNWQFDGGDPYVPGTDTIVPGDSLSKVCDLTLTLTGDHIGATLGLDTTTPSFGAANALTPRLSPTASFQVNNAAYAPITQPGVYHVQVTVTVPFTSAATDGQSLSAALNAVVVTATQTHDTTANS